MAWGLKTCGERAKTIAGRVTKGLELKEKANPAATNVGPGSVTWFVTFVAPLEHRADPDLPLLYAGGVSGVHRPWGVQYPPHPPCLFPLKSYP